MAESTVRFYVNHIFGKLNISDRIK
ncbi:hypothetical protein ACWATR_25100 [Nostoc sp. UIC 10890]